MSVWWSKLTRRRDAVRQAVREADPVLLLQMLAFASVVPLLMRRRLPRLGRLLEPCPPRRRSAHTADTIIRHFALARRIGSPLVGSGCLTRGVTLCYFCRHAGIDVALSFGLTRKGDAFTGHCWLTNGDVPFLEHEDPRPLYAHIVTVPDSSHRAPRYLPAQSDLGSP